MVHSNSYHGTLEYHGTPTIYNFFYRKDVHVLQRLVHIPIRYLTHGYITESIPTE
jgi:hypothetical protein